MLHRSVLAISILMSCGNVFADWTPKEYYVASSHFDDVNGVKTGIYRPRAFVDKWAACSYMLDYYRRNSPETKFTLQKVQVFGSDSGLFVNDGGLGCLVKSEWWNGDNFSSVDWWGGSRY